MVVQRRLRSLKLRLRKVDLSCFFLLSCECARLHMNYLQYCGARVWQQGILWRAPTPGNFVLGTSLSLRSPPHPTPNLTAGEAQKRTARQLWTSKNERIGRLIQIFYTRITNWQLFTRTTELKLSGFYRIYSNGNFKIGNGLTTQSSD